MKLVVDVISALGYFRKEFKTFVIDVSSIQYD